MDFPTSLLTPKDGEISAHIFQHQQIGGQPGLFWNISI